MKKYLFLLPFILLTLSCNNNQSSKDDNQSNNVTVIEYSDSIVISNVIKADQPLAKGLEEGFVEQTKTKYGSCETQMINQFTDYIKALNECDIDKCLKYINKESFNYVKKLAAADGEHLEFSEFAQNMAKDMKEFQDRFKKREVKITMVIPSLIRRIDDGDNIFIVFTNTTNLTGKNGKSLHLSPVEKTLGISSDKGVNWTFISLNEDLPNILNGIYDDEVINAIMDY